jgi:hypothetical protein
MATCLGQWRVASGVCWHLSLSVSAALMSPQVRHKFHFPDEETEVPGGAGTCPGTGLFALCPQ